MTSAINTTKRRIYSTTLRPIREIEQDELADALRRAVDRKIVDMFEKSRTGMDKDDLLQEAHIIILKQLKEHPDSLFNFPRLVQLVRFRLLDVLKYVTRYRTLDHDGFTNIWRFGNSLQLETNRYDHDNEYFLHEESERRSMSERSELNSRLTFKDIIEKFNLTSKEKTLLLGHYFYGFDKKECGEIVGYRESNTSLKYAKLREHFKELCPTPEAFREKFFHD